MQLASTEILYLRGCKPEVSDTLDGVTVVNAHDVIEAESPSHFNNNYRATAAFVRDWCTANDAIYYAAPNDKFSVQKAVQKAQRNGKDIVVVDNLS